MHEFNFVPKKNVYERNWYDFRDNSFTIVKRSVLIVVSRNFITSGGSSWTKLSIAGAGRLSNLQYSRY